MLAVVLIGWSVPGREQRYIFDWDQADDYQKVETMVKSRIPVLIGPRVTGEKGFFLGPWHYYFLLPFYLATDGSLEMGFWAAVAVQLITMGVVYWRVGKRWGETVGVAGGLVTATPVFLTAWGFMYVPLLAVWFFFEMLETLEKPEKLPWLYFWFGLGCTTYAVFYALVIPLLAVTAVVWRRGKLTKKMMIRSALGWGCFYLPTLIFDLRHDFLNLKNALNFGGGERGSGANSWYLWKILWQTLGTTLVPIKNRIAAGIMAVAILGLTAWGIREKEKPAEKIIWLWLAAPVIMLAGYRGNISEYYLATTMVMIPLVILGFLAKKGEKWLWLLVIIIIAARFDDRLGRKAGMTLADKVEIARRLDKIGQSYSVSYELAPGGDGGYEKIMQKTGRKFTADGSGQLYTVAEKDRKVSGEKVFAIKGVVIYKR